MIRQNRSLSDIMGLNRRNLDIISFYNKRKYFPVVDNKITTKEYLDRGNVPHPQTIGVIENFFEIDEFTARLKEIDTFVIKPSRGRAGGGILLLEKQGENWQTPSGRRVTEDDLKKHLGDILFGVYSFGNAGDQVLIEERVFPHSFFEDIYPRGVADIRIITFKSVPIMAMVRIPTDQSDGKANLHQGAIGISLDLNTGMTGNSLFRGKPIEKHPDSEKKLSGRVIPHWENIRELSERASRLIPLGYLGIDFVIDRKRGPLILELNARPGLQIQVINGRGLSPLIQELEEQNAD